jgi:hypothetical protein
MTIHIKPLVGENAVLFVKDPEFSNQRHYKGQIVFKGGRYFLDGMEILPGNVIAHSGNYYKAGTKGHLEHLNGQYPGLDTEQYKRFSSYIEEVSDAMEKNASHLITGREDEPFRCPVPDDIAESREMLFHLAREFTFQRMEATIECSGTKVYLRVSKNPDVTGAKENKNSSSKSQF